MLNQKLAKVTKGTLEIKERGILNFYIFVDYEDFGSQGVGGIALDKWDEEKQHRVGTAYGCEMIRQLLLFFNVNNLEEVKNQVVYVLGEGEGLSFRPKGFRHLKCLRDGRPEEMLFEKIYEEFGDD